MLSFRRHRLARLMLPAALIATLALSAAPARAAEAPDSATAESQEWQLLDLVNRDRAAAGVAPLKMQTTLRDYARYHARAERTAGTIWHDMNEYSAAAPSGWRSLGENVAYNYSVTSMHDAYMNSSGHRANILNASYTYIGIGIMADGGRLYNSEDFMGHPSTTLPVATRPGTPSGDTTAPAVALTSPSAGATVSGTTTLAATASDNVGVTKVEFRVDGAVKATDSRAPYSFSWNSRTATNGSHDVTVRAQDAAGNSKTSAPVRVTVANSTADTAAPSAPGAPRVIAVTSRYALFDWSAAVDNVGVTGYRVYGDGNEIGVVKGAGFADFDVMSGNSRRYSIRAYDAAGNLGPVSPELVVTTP